MTIGDGVIERLKQKLEGDIRRRMEPALEQMVILERSMKKLNDTLEKLNETGQELVNLLKSGVVRR